MPSTLTHLPGPVKQGRALLALAPFLLLVLTLAAPGGVHGQTQPQADGDLLYAVSLSVDFGVDFGRPLGSLFEVRDSQGRPVLGAGFASTYNTMLQGNRHMLQFYLRGPGDADLNVEDQVVEDMVVEALPRPNQRMGAFLTTNDNTLHANTLAYDAPAAWDPAVGAWLPQGAEPPRYYETPLADGALVFAPGRVEFKGRTIFEGQGSALYFYGNGHLFAWQEGRAPGEKATVRAMPWFQNMDRASADHASVLELGTANAFPYCYGVLGQDVLMASNAGRVYAFDGRSWRELDPDRTTGAMQFYSMLNMGERVILGEYPHGSLVAWDGKDLALISAPPGYGPEGHFEAQTLALHAGDLYVGMWPWGELWRFDPDQETWASVTRLFTAPDRHGPGPIPFQAQVEAHMDDYYLWPLGQRVYSLVPLGGDLYASTTSMGGREELDAYPFLAPGVAEQYGRVLRIRDKAGAEASAQIRWPQGPTTFRLELRRDCLLILQDGEELTRRELDQVPNVSAWSDPVLGQGLFGPLTGTMTAHEVARPGGAQDREAD